jgi:hypothetical protein
MSEKRIVEEAIKSEAIASKGAGRETTTRSFFASSQNRCTRLRGGSRAYSRAQRRLWTCTRASGTRKPVAA